MEFNLTNVLIVLTIFSSSCADPKLKMPKLKVPKRLPKISGKKGSSSRPSYSSGDFGFSNIFSDAILSNEDVSSYDVMAVPKKSSSSQTQTILSVRDPSSIASLVTNTTPKNSIIQLDHPRQKINLDGYNGLDSSQIIDARQPLQLPSEHHHQHTGYQVPKFPGSPSPSDNGDPLATVLPQTGLTAHEESPKSSLKQTLQPAVGLSMDTVSETVGSRVIPVGIAEHNNSATQVEKNSMMDSERTSNEPQVANGSYYNSGAPDIMETLSSSVLPENETNSQPDSIIESPPSLALSPEQVPVPPIFNNRNPTNCFSYSSPSTVTVTPYARILMSNSEKSDPRDPDCDGHPLLQTIRQRRKQGRRIRAAVNALHQKLLLIRQQQIQAKLQWQRENYQIQSSFIDVGRELLEIHEEQAMLMD